MTSLLSIGYFLLSVFFTVTTAVLWLRIALRYFRVSSLHPVSYGVLALTDPVIKPIDDLFGFRKQRLSRYDWASFLALIVIELIKFTLIGFLALKTMMPMGLLLLYTVADLIIQPCNLLFYAIIIRVIMSWVNPGWRHPFAELLYLITEPALRLGRRLIPDISGFDFSPFIIILMLKVITMFVEGFLPVPLV